MHIGNKKKDIAVLSKGPPEKLSDTKTTAEAKYFTNFTRSRRKLCLNLHVIGNFDFCLLMP